MFLYNLPFMLFVLKLGLKRFITDPETLDQDSEEVMEIFGMLLVEVMLGMRALAVCLLVAILLGFSRWMAIQENLDYVDAIPRVRSALAGRKVLSTPDLSYTFHRRALFGAEKMLAPGGFHTGDARKPLLHFRRCFHGQTSELARPFCSEGARRLIEPFPISLEPARPARMMLQL